MRGYYNFFGKVIMQTTSYNINFILERVRSNVYVIPQFQRKFTWNSSQVKRLIDSIARNYPIGSLLTLAKSQEINLHSRAISACIMDEDGITQDIDNYEKEVQYVLDGQQRLTSIVRVFLDADLNNTYYFDLKKMYEAFEQEENDWIVRIRKPSGKSDSERKKDNKLIRADLVLNQAKTNMYISEYFEDSVDFLELASKENRTKRREVIAKIQGIFEVIRNYQLPVVVLDHDAPLESVCRVFETINSTGTKLTTFDLAVARFYPDPDLRDLWDNSRKQFDTLELFDVDGERVLQILALWEDRTKRSGSNSFSEVTRSKLLKIDKSFINDNWDVAVKVLVDTYGWARRLGATPTTLSNHAILVAIAASNIIYQHKMQSAFANPDSLLRKWYFNKIMPPVKFTATNYRISEDFRALCDFFEGGKPLEFKEVKLSKDTIKSINKPQDNRYKAIQSIISITAKEDLISGAALSLDDLEDHHIFPRSLKGRNKDELDSVVNRILISKKTNRELSNSHPKEYFRRLKEQATQNKTLNQAKERLKACFLPDNIESSNFVDQFDDSSFHNFLDTRADLIRARIKEILEDSLSDDISNIDDEDDES